MKRTKWYKALALIMAIVIVAVSCPIIFADAEKTTIHLAVFSDIHYFPDSLKGNFNDAYKRHTYLAGKEYTENNSLLNNALQGTEAILSKAEEENAEFLLIPGDLTKEGELEGHIELAAKLEAWQARTGIPVYVINGNHDINNSKAMSFKDGVQGHATVTTPEDFREVYKNLGYDKADAFFTPKKGNKGGMLSYAADLGENYRLIAVDTNMYSPDNGAEDSEHLTDGRVGPDLLKWIQEQAAQANKDGKTIILMQHHNLVPHMDIEEATFFAFVLQDWEQIADAYADAGIHYILSGHLHASDTSSYVNDNGERITDILSPTLTGYPNNFRGIDVTSDGTETTIDMINYDIDEESLGLPQITSDFGDTYERPYKYTQSYEQTFGNNIRDFVERLLEKLTDQYFTKIQEAGGIIPFLKTMGVDVEQILIDLIGTNGIAVGDMDILTVRTNAMGLINDIDKQIMDNYVTKPKETIDMVMGYVDKLLSIQVSEYPATLNHELLGTPLTGKGCTFGEFATTVLLLYYGGDECVYGKPGYEYVKDTLDNFASGELTETVFRSLVDVVVNGLVKDEILSNIDLNPGALFPEGTALSILGKLLQAITESLTGGDNSFTNIIESILSISVVPEKYNSIDNLLNTLLLDKYFTKTQFEAWGQTVSWMIKTLVFDENPDEKMDNNITMTYSGKENVEATKDNYRLPADVVMTLTSDTETSATITWVTKYSITESDIEIIPYSTSPEFTGKATKTNVTSSSETEKLSYPGADFGVFSFLPYERDFVKHTVTVTNLEPGTKYSYRVGSAERGWWSDAGVITTAGGDEAFTFLNVADPQAQCAIHYESFGNVMNAALGLYPDARFTVSSGDQVVSGKNMKHWSYFLNSSSSFMSVPFMPTSGDQEDSGDVFNNYFALPNVPDQDTETGVYYSYDYNNVHFTVLNTNDLTDNKLSNEQLEWLKKDVQSSDAQWHIVVLHNAIYANGQNYKSKDTTGLRNQLSALLPYLGVDLVLEGNDRVYTRTGVMNANCVMPVNTESVTYNGQTYEMKLDPNGTVYSIVGAVGENEYSTVSTSDTNKYFPEAEATAENDYPMFTAITVDGNSLYYNAYQVIDGEAKLVDSFGIKKSDDNKSPADKLGDNAFSRLISSILSKLNIKLTWKISNFFLKIFAPLFKVFKSI